MAPYVARWRLRRDGRPPCGRRMTCARLETRGSGCQPAASLRSCARLMTTADSLGSDTLDKTTITLSSVVRAFRAGHACIAVGFLLAIVYVSFRVLPWSRTSRAT